MPTYVSSAISSISTLPTGTQTVTLIPATTPDVTGVMGYTTFYHYTSYEGLQGIKRSGHIRLSPDRHSHFGTGVYGTSLPPWSGKRRIARNNWKRHGDNYICSGSCDWAIEVKIPSRKVKHVRRSGRDILVFEGGPLKLDDFKWKELEVDDDVTSDESSSDDSY